jgi:hypothetical protein
MKHVTSLNIIFCFLNPKFVDGRVKSVIACMMLVNNQRGADAEDDSQLQRKIATVSSDLQNNAACKTQ